MADPVMLVPVASAVCVACGCLTIVAVAFMAFKFDWSKLSRAPGKDLSERLTAHQDDVAALRARLQTDGAEVRGELELLKVRDPGAEVKARFVTFQDELVALRTRNQSDAAEAQRERDALKREVSELSYTVEQQKKYFAEKTVELEALATKLLVAGRERAGFGGMRRA